MTIWDRLFGRKHDEEAHQPPAMPWDQHPSIYEHIRSHIVEGKPGVTDEGDTLPDDERLNKDNKIRWAAGAMDGVMSHHLMASEESEEGVGKTVELTLAYSRQPTAVNKAALYQHIIAEHIVSIIDPVIEAIIKESEINHDRLYELAYSFVTEAPDREPVKFGLAILGLFRNPANEELFQTLGRHDEFTLYCAVALRNVTEDGETALWKLAQNVTGWGRIHCVVRLSDATNPAIKDWLLREGYRNNIMYEYLAATCARTGGLLEALSRDHVDKELLVSAGEIIEALINGGPAENIDDYEDARPVLESFLGHMESRASTVEDFLYVNAIKQLMTLDGEHWEARYNSGWTEDFRSRCRSLCESIVSRPQWEPRIREQLGSDDEMAFSRTDRAAKALGIDTWEIHWSRLQAKPSDSGRWYHVMVGCDEDRIDRVLEFAKRAIDLNAIATGASNEMGLGKKFEQHTCLNYVLQDLHRFPGRAPELVVAGLKSPVIRSRNCATNVLANWPKDAWSSELASCLYEAANSEPDQQVKERMKKVLNGEPLDDDV